MSAISRKTSARPTLRKTPTGIIGLDEITGGGLPSGRPSLICGAAGAGKTLMGIEFIVNGILQYDEPGVIISFEEKAEDLESNVSSLGFNLKKLQKEGKLKINYVRVERSEIDETGEY
ncbi:MAG: ATPase domain-containing protein, partial [Chitinophagaceae bacterium]